MRYSPIDKPKCATIRVVAVVARLWHICTCHNACCFVACLWQGLWHGAQYNQRVMVAVFSVLWHVCGKAIKRVPPSGLGALCPTPLWREFCGRSCGRQSWCTATRSPHQATRKQLRHRRILRVAGCSVVDCGSQLGISSMKSMGCDRLKGAGYTRSRMSLMLTTKRSHPTRVPIHIIKNFFLNLRFVTCSLQFACSRPARCHLTSPAWHPTIRIPR